VTRSVTVTFLSSFRRDPECHRHCSQFLSTWPGVSPSPFLVSIDVTRAVIVILSVPFNRRDPSSHCHLFQFFQIEVIRAIAVNFIFYQDRFLSRSIDVPRTSLSISISVPSGDPSRRRQISRFIIQSSVTRASHIFQDRFIAGRAVAV
jgi:hypothetical protein